jgi:hypothetical protein
MIKSVLTTQGISIGIDKPVMLICRQCGLASDKDCFRRRYAGRDLRIRQCRGCHAYAERLRRHGRRSAAQRREVTQQLARLKKAKSEHQVVAVCEALVHAGGGLDALAAVWHQTMRKDLARGGQAGLRHLEAIIRLIQHCDARRPDPRKMTDAELDRLAQAAEAIHRPAHPEYR